MKKAVIYPAILRQTFEDILADVYKVTDHFDYFQIDLVDGVFAENTTWPFAVGDNIHESRLSLDILQVDFELDLMLKNPESTLPLWLSTPAKKIIIHYNSTQNLKNCLEGIKKSNKDAIVAIQPGFEVKKLKEFEELIDGVQCMGIEVIGKQGEPFSERAVTTVKELRAEFPKMAIHFDGAVSANNIDKLRKAGASRFGVGSAIYSGDVEENIKKLLEIIN